MLRSLNQTHIKNKQIKGITLQKTNFKIIQYADDTTFACQDFLEIEKIQEELHKFEKVSGLKINSEKTQILTTSLSFQEKIKLHYPTFNIKDSFKLLGIKFFLNPNQKMKNWKEVIPKIRGIILKHDTRNLSIFGKIQIIKTLVIPLFIHIARIYRPTTKIIKEINQILYKFLWTKHPIEQLSRSKLIAEIKEGGIKMIDIESKINTCYVEKIKYLVNIDQSSEIWHQWATYNLFYKIKHINKKLFDRTKAHNLFGNETWNYTFSLFMSLKKYDIEWDKISHKKIYLLLKQIKSEKTQILNKNKEIIPWKNIILKTKNIKKYFNNNEREVNYRIATNAYKWHQTNITKNCNFCQKPPDSIEHILLKCKPIQKIWQNLENYLKENEIAKIKLNKDIILYNHYKKDQKNMIKILKIIVSIKNQIIEKKKELDKQNHYTWSNKQFQRHIMSVINTIHENLS